jgi:pimeloyl-ACP methyl ester carboxylesterase
MADIALTNGISLAYDEAGDADGRPVVLLHGVSMSRQYFHTQLGPLSAKHHVVAVDLRGHGGSEKVDSGHTIPQYARDVKLFIEALALERPVLVGWSMGAFVAFDYIKQFGTGGIRGLIVVDEAASDFKWDGFPHGFIDLPALHSFMSDLQADKEAFLRHLVPEMFHSQPAPDDLEWMVSECARLPIGALSAILFDQSVQDYRDLIGAIDVPTLICWGRHDALLPVSGASHLLEHLPHARLVLFEDSGHCPFIEESDKFNRAVDDFVSAV